MNDCKRYTVFAMAVAENGETAVAKNGNEAECTGVEGNCGCTHAEELLLKEMPHPERIFLSHSPCEKCAELIINAGVSKVIYSEEYRDRKGIEKLRENNIAVKKGGE